MLLTWDHDDGVPGGDGRPKNGHQGEEGAAVGEDNPHDSQSFRQGQTRAGPWHRLQNRETKHDKEETSRQKLEQLPQLETASRVPRVTLKPQRRRLLTRFPPLILSQ